MTRRTYVETAPSARDDCELFRQAFGPMIAIRAGLADRPERLEIPYEYLLVVARKRAEPGR